MPVDRAAASNSQNSEPNVEIKLCRRRVLRAEKLMRELLRAHDASEAGNVQAALERMRRFLEEV